MCTFLRWPRRLAVLLQLVERWTDHRIVLNPFTETSGSGGRTLIPHGDYRPWYGPSRPSDPTPWRIGAFGAIRRYKSIDALLPAYADAAAKEQRLSLLIGGRPSTTRAARRGGAAGRCPS